jgi:hypothetical protein
VVSLKQKPTTNVPQFQRRFEFKLYPTAEQAALLHERRHQIGELKNAILQRYEDHARRQSQLAKDDRHFLTRTGPLLWRRTTQHQTEEKL